jgi:bud emergence protein 1
MAKLICRFVAKPIGRLGGPGLIPVAFVEIRDPATGRPIEVLPDTIPMVEEWKKATADYKAAAIPLGRFDFPPEQHAPQQPLGDPSYAPSTHTGSSSQSQARSQQSHSPMPRSGSNTSIGKTNGNVNGNGHTSARHELYRPEEDPLLPPGEMAALEVPSFHNETGSYWFRIQVLFHPDDRSAPAYALSLYRTYEDFYEFQINLLDTFPFEAGRPAPGKEDQSPPERILPYMPGPVDDAIDDELTEYRREELDAYVRALVDLKLRGAGYILRHDLIRGFFAAKYGDHCQDAERQDAVEELDEGLANTRISDGRGYQPDHRAPSAMSRNSQKSMPGGPGGYQGSGHASQASLSHSRQPSRGPSPMQMMQGSVNESSSSSGRPPSGTRQHMAQPSSGSLHNSNPGHLSGPLSTATTSSSWGHPPNSAASGITPTSANQPPYVKIKIYDRATDDLIAIRVHPNVTYNELYDKVLARLGSAVSALRYKDASMGGGGGYREIRDDGELREWMRIEDQKLVLYAEQ